MDKKHDSMAIMKSIKKIVHTGGSDNLHAKHNNVMAHNNFMSLYQEKISRHSRVLRPVHGSMQGVTELGYQLGNVRMI